VHIDYSVSLWNYTHYADSPSLERIAASLRAHSYGIELWGNWRDEKDLYDETGRARLKAALHGMQVSMHSTMDANTIERQQKQIDTAAAIGAGVIVLHPSDLRPTGTTTLDVALARDAVAYAQAKGVRLALENTREISFLVDAMTKVDGMRICLDVGHVYLADAVMADVLAAIKHRLIHLHIQDLLSPLEVTHLPGIMKDHYIPGTGGIPRPDWELLAQTLQEIDFNGAAVLEIQPRKPLQTALLTKTFLHGLWGPD
jgi:sugar phosphate isomerase/epimerase